LGKGEKPVFTGSGPGRRKKKFNLKKGRRRQHEFVKKDTLRIKKKV